jgi:hypothetical protein
MTMIVHRNVAKKHFCPGCDHFHEVPNPGLPTPSGVCVLNPPQAFVVGMGQAAIAPMDKPGAAVPIIRGYYPPVGPGDTCAQWTPRAEGEG